MVTRYSIERVIALWTLGKAHYPDLPSVACDALELGFDGDAIRRLAVLDKPSYFQVGDLFQRAIAEMKISPPSKREAVIFLAREIAREILAGREEALNGAYKIFLLGYAADFPREIVIFGGLDQEFDVPEILELCRPCWEMTGNDA
jgi:hypothetical protein